MGVVGRRCPDGRLYRASLSPEYLRGAGGKITLRMCCAVQRPCPPGGQLRTKTEAIRGLLRKLNQYIQELIMTMKIYTKTGDDGTTGLFGGQRVLKSDIRIESYGTVDELNSVLGVALASGMPEEMRQELERISALLLTVGADLATPLNPPPRYAIPRVTESDVQQLERLIDEYESDLEPLKNFILPGGTPAAAHLHLARTVCRRAERSVVALAGMEDIGTAVAKFLNRLSDFLFVAARRANHLAGKGDITWVNPALGR